MWTGSIVFYMCKCLHLVQASPIYGCVFVLIFMLKRVCLWWKLPSHYFPVSNNKLAVLLSEYWTANQNLTESHISTSLGIPKIRGDNSNVNMPYYFLHSKYAAFLSECSKPAEAVRKLLDAMIYFNIFLKNKAPDGTNYPEQNNCGKFTIDYYRKLEKYYNEWKVQNPDTRWFSVISI